MPDLTAGMISRATTGPASRITTPPPIGLREGCADPNETYPGAGALRRCRSSLLRSHLLSEDPIMGLFSKDIVTFDDLFLHQLQDVYYAENQITKALPKMVAKATAPALKQGFETHLRETEGQITRLERIFDLLGEKAKAVTCPAIDGIIKEANEVAGEIEDKAVLDAALIASAQAVEHYEITRYGTLIAWANQLGRADIAAILKETLDEEYATDDKLTAMATSSVNVKAEAVTA
ncbi:MULTISPECIES: ferritin-like domain-containing protein [Sphingomonas]|nr:MULTISPECIES: ferritin-like domain-containing protein [Sphingomonas]MDY0968844.1 ferritin-like domain-containing protein [Sphingomonas sp. CFBP9021]USR01675.1 ferritin-like domain-containing protein [Sphingomonas aerolata]